jgi:hypothetical protein
MKLGTVFSYVELVSIVKSVTGTHCTGGCSLNGCCVGYLGAVISICYYGCYSMCGRNLLRLLRT